MIIKQIFHTYKDDFPLIVTEGNLVSLSSNLSETQFLGLFKELIFELSELSDIPKYCYMTRHTDDSPEEGVLKPFKERFGDFVSQRSNSKFDIPTVWFVGYFKNRDSIKLVEKELSNKNIRHWNHGTEYPSIEFVTEDSSYAPNAEELKMFPVFLQQMTKIGIDLLKNNSSNKLRELAELEWMLGNKLDSKVEELKNHLETNSEYYREKIDENEKSKLWSNFRIVRHCIKGNMINSLSWPHFLFNICGESRPPLLQINIGHGYQ